MGWSRKAGQEPGQPKRPHDSLLKCRTADCLQGGDKVTPRRHGAFAATHPTRHFSLVNPPEAAHMPPRMPAP